MTPEQHLEITRLIDSVQEEEEWLEVNRLLQERWRQIPVDYSRRIAVRAGSFVEWRAV